VPDRATALAVGAVVLVRAVADVVFAPAFFLPAFAETELRIGFFTISLLAVAVSVMVAGGTVALSVTSEASTAR